MLRYSTRYAAAIFALLTVLSFQVYAAPTIVGAFKVTIAGAPANSPAIFLVGIQQGGVVNIAQANAFRSMAIGHWDKIGPLTYKFRDTHLVYEDSDPYAVIATEEHFVELELDQTGAEFTGEARLVTTDLDGNVLSDFNLDVVGVRLPEGNF